MSNQAVTGAAFPLDFYEEKDGRKIKVSLRANALSDVDIAEMDIWVQTRYITMARRAAKELDAEERREEIDIAQRRAAMLTAFSGEGARLIGGTVEGMTRLCWQMVHTNHPDITEERLRHLLLNPMNLQMASQVFHQANVAPNVKPNANKGGAKKKRR